MLITHLYLSGMWFGVAPITGTKKDMYSKEIGLHV